MNITQHDLIFHNCVMCQGLNFDSCERYDSTFIFLLISIILEIFFITNST